MSRAVGEGYVLQPGEGRLIDLGGFSMFVKATDEAHPGTRLARKRPEQPMMAVRVDHTILPVSVG